MNENFIKQTARDYDMSEFQVRVYYEKYFELGTFYDELEKFVQSRANSLQES
jgi:hypothetical protein